jgi:hypothetical protein
MLPPVAISGGAFTLNEVGETRSPQDMRATPDDVRPDPMVWTDSFLTVLCSYRNLATDRPALGRWTAPVDSDGLLSESLPNVLGQQGPSIPYCLQSFSGKEPTAGTARQPANHRVRSGLCHPALQRSSTLGG